MDIKGLIKKVDQDRKKLTVYPGLKELIPTKSVYQNNFLMQLNTTLDSHKPNDETKKLKQALDTTKKSAIESSKSIAQQGKITKDINQQDQPKKLLEKVQLIKGKLDNAKIGFLTKKKLHKIIGIKETKYLDSAKIVEDSDKILKKLSSFATKEISQEQLNFFKDKLKELGYYQSVIEDPACEYSIMPELLNKRSLLGGEKYE